MSYFLAGPKSKRQEMAALDAILLESVPPKTERVAIEDGRWLLRSYQESKCIQDLILRHDKSESWLALVGTPLVKAHNDDQIEALMDGFLDDPARTIQNEIDGHFALMAYDSINKRFIVASDCNCFVPVYYSTSPKGLFVCSSELALAKFTATDIDPLGFAQAINLGVSWGSTTRFTDIHKLRPCEMLTVEQNGKVSRTRYWEPSDVDLWEGTFDEIEERWAALLRAAVISLHEASGAETALVDFTAGEDSRLVVALCEASGIPYQAQVRGFPGDTDILIAGRAAQQAGFSLDVRPSRLIDEEQLLSSALQICLATDGYESFFRTSIRVATDLNNPAPSGAQLHLSGLPGGEAFRGTYYKRAKLMFPSAIADFDYKFFTKLKFLLDFRRGFLNFPDEDFLDAIYASVRENLSTVEAFPAGLRVDHLLREFQTSVWGLGVKTPFYNPLGLKEPTQSIYRLLPRYKRGGRLTKACTEDLFPRLAATMTQKGVPTIRKTWRRLPQFLPEYVADAKKAVNGVSRRLLHLKQSSATLAKEHRLDYHGPTMKALLTSEPYSAWFSSTDSMLTGRFFNSAAVNQMLDEARRAECSYVQLLGRIINQELACRYVYGSGAAQLPAATSGVPPPPTTA